MYTDVKSWMNKIAQVYQDFLRVLQCSSQSMSSSLTYYFHPTWGCSYLLSLGVRDKFGSMCVVIVYYLLTSCLGPNRNVQYELNT